MSQPPFNPFLRRSLNRLGRRHCPSCVTLLQLPIDGELFFRAPPLRKG